MISFNDFQEILANSFFDGDLQIAGIVMYIGIMLLTIAVSKNTFYALLIGMAATMLFSILGILNTEVTVLLIIVSVLGLAYTSRSVWRD